jgi:hypothetical protein
MHLMRRRCPDIFASKLWITAQKLWINRAYCGEVAQLFGFAPPYLAGISLPIQNLDGAKISPNRLLKAVGFLPVFSTACGDFSLKSLPALGAEHLAWSQVGASGGSPHIHRPYYHYY